MKQKLKSLVWTLVKLAVCAAIFWYIFNKHEEQILLLPETLRNARYGWLVPAFLLALTTLVIGAWRWQILLRPHGVELPFSHVLAINWIGAFFNNFLPGGTGGDLIKLIYAIKGMPERKAGAFMSIVVDRLVGLCGLFVVFSSMLALNVGPALANPETRHFVLVGIAMMAGFACVIGLGLWRSLPRHVPLAGKLLERLPMRERFKTLIDAYHCYVGHPRVLLATLGMSVAIHLLVVAGAWFLAMTFVPGGVSITRLMFIVPLINLITAIPITPGGLGMREMLYIKFLGMEKVAEGASTAISLSVLGLNILVSLPGGLIYLVYRQQHEKATGTADPVQAP